MYSGHDSCVFMEDPGSCGMLLLASHSWQRFVEV